MSAIFLIDASQLAVVKAVMTRLNDPYTLKVGEKFDLGRKLEAIVMAVEDHGPLDDDTEPTL